MIIILIQAVEHQERARALIRKEKLNKKRWQSEPRAAKKTPSPVKISQGAEKSKVEVDQNKKEIRLTLPVQLELEKLANLQDASTQVTPQVQRKSLAPTVSPVVYL